MHAVPRGTGPATRGQAAARGSGAHAAAGVGEPGIEGPASFDGVEVAAVDVGTHATRVAAGRELLGVLPAGIGPDPSVTAFTAARARRWGAVPVGEAIRRGLGLPPRWLVIDAGARAVRLHAPDGTVRVVDAGGDRLDADVARLLAGLPARPQDVRLLRETLSLQPAATLPAGDRRMRIEAAAVKELLAERLGEVAAAARALVRAAGLPITGAVLVGGVARTPLLASLVQAALDGLPVLVAPIPDLAAVLGAAIVASEPGSMTDWTATREGAIPAPDGRVQAVLVAELGSAESRGCAVAWDPPAGHPAGSVPGAGRKPNVDGAAEGAAGRLLPLPPPRRARMVVAWLVGAAAAVAAAAGVASMPAGPPAQAPAEGGAVLVQYGYRFELPAGWEHTGALPERRRTLLTQAGAPDGTGLLVVERTYLGYDARAEPGRALAELTARFATEAAAEGMSDLVVGERVAGRAVVRFRQTSGLGRRADGSQSDPVSGPVGGPRNGAEHGPANGAAGGSADTAVVEWFVLFEGTDQFSVGCRHPAAGSAEVDQACAVVVGSVRPA